LTVEIHVQILTVEIHVQILTVEIHVKITFSQKKTCNLVFLCLLIGTWFIVKYV